MTENCAGGVALSHAATYDSRKLKPEFNIAAVWRGKGRRECMEKGMKGVVSAQLCLERQLESGVFPTQVGQWNAREQWYRRLECKG